MTISASQVGDYFKGKSLILFTVTKDLIHFLRLYKDYKPDFEIKAIVDVSLPYRPNIREKILSESGSIPVLESLDDYDKIVSSGDIVIKFDHAVVADRLLDQLRVVNTSDFSNSSLEVATKQSYDVYINQESGNEWTHIMYPEHQAKLNTHLVCSKDIQLMQCYGDNLLIMGSSDNFPSRESFSQFLDSKLVSLSNRSLDIGDNNFNINLWKLANKESRNQKVRFVVSGDWGGGKFSYIRSTGCDFITPDSFMMMFDRNSYYGAGGIDSRRPLSKAAAIQEALARREYLKGHEEPVYVKLEGCLAGFSFPFMLGNSRLQSLDNIHKFYRDYEFHVLVSKDDNLEDVKSDLISFCKQNDIDPTRVKVIEVVDHCASFNRMLESADDIKELEQW